MAASPKLKPAQVEAAVRSGTTRGAYLFAGGADEDRISLATMIRDRLVAPGFESFNYVTLDGDEDGPEAVLDEALTPAMGGGGRVVVLRHPRSLASKEALDRIISYLASPDPANCLILMEEGWEGTHRLFTAAEKAGALVDFRIWESEHAGIVVRELRNLGLTAEPGAQALLAERLGAEPGLLRRELEKIMVAFPAGTRLRQRDVEELIAGSAPVDSFKAADAFSRRDWPGLLRLVERLVTEEEQEVTMILGALAGRARLHLQWLVRRRGGDAAYVRELSALKHFGTKKLVDSRSAAFTEEELRDVLGVLQGIDYSCKTGALPRERQGALLTVALAGMLLGERGSGAPGVLLDSDPAERV